MDKETLLRIAQPLATILLALSIVSFPLISVASSKMLVVGSKSIYDSPIKVKLIN